MSLPSAWAVQVGLYEFLRQAAPLSALIGSPGRVYDRVPEDASFPFLTIGESQQRPIDGVDGAVEHDVRINAYTRWGGRREAKLLADCVQIVLQDASLSVEDHKLISCRFIFSDIFRQADPDTYQATIRFRVVTEPIPQLI